MKLLMGKAPAHDSSLSGMTRKLTDGNSEMLANSINNFLVSVSSNLSRLDESNNIFKNMEQLPAELYYKCKRSV